MILNGKLLTYKGISASTYVPLNFSLQCGRLIECESGYLVKYTVADMDARKSSVDVLSNFNQNNSLNITDLYQNTLMVTNIKGKPERKFHGDVGRYGDVNSLYFLFGDIGVTVPKNPNYTYIWYLREHLFSIYDEYGTEILRKPCRYMAELGIDYETAESHNFIIWLKGAEFRKFILMCQLLKRIFCFNIKSIDWGSGEFYFLDYVDTQSKPVFLPLLISTSNTTSTEKHKQLIQHYLQEMPKLFPLVNFNSLIADCYFEVSILDRLVTAGSKLKPKQSRIKITRSVLFSKTNIATNVSQISNKVYTKIKTKQLSKVIKTRLAHKLNLNILRSLLTLSLYPQLLPVEMQGELFNNRPVYEPWMILNIFKYIFNKVKGDYPVDESGLDIFDLSPDW